VDFCEENKALNPRNERVKNASAFAAPREVTQKAASARLNEGGGGGSYGRTKNARMNLPFYERLR